MIYVIGNLFKSNERLNRVKIYKTNFLAGIYSRKKIIANLGK